MGIEEKWGKKLMFLLYRTSDIDEYKLAHIEDIEIFHDIINNNLFDKEDMAIESQLDIQIN